jgi:hypothetical protein
MIAKPHALFAPDRAGSPKAPEQPAAQDEQSLAENRVKAAAKMVQARSKPRWEGRSHLGCADTPPPSSPVLPDEAIAKVAQIIGVTAEALQPHAETLRSAVAMYVSAARTRADHEEQTVTRAVLESVASGVEGVLHKLGTSVEGAADGPDERFLRALALAGMEEDEARVITAKLGRLHEVVQQARKTLRLPERAELNKLQLAENGAIDPAVAVRLAGLARAGSGRGDPVLDVLIGPLTCIFREVAGTQAGVTVNAGQGGETGGRFVRLVQAVWALAAAEKDFPPGDRAHRPTGHMIAEALRRLNLGQEKRQRGRPKGSGGSPKP